MIHRFRIVAFLFVAVLLLGSLWGAGAPATAQDPQPQPAAPPPGEGPWVVRAYYTDRTMLDSLATWTEPWEVNRQEGYIVLDVDRAGYQWLLDAGFRVEVDPRLTAELTRPREPLPGQTEGIPGYPCYRTVEETFDTAQALAAAHPTLATWTDIGDSWEKVNNPAAGYDMMVLRLTNSAVPGPKPKLFIMAAIHAREYTTAELITRFAEYLVENYDLDPDVTWLLDYHEIHLLLQSNPDGRKKAEAGQLWRKNTHPYGSCAPSSIGVDLNRNYPFQWGCCGGSSGNPCAETYRGPSAASEPETQAVVNYVQAQFPDQRGPGLGDPAPADAMGVFMDIHSYSQLVLWPWGFTSSPAPNGTALQTLGRKFAYFNGYTPEQAYGLYVTDGTTDDFAYGDLGLAAYTFELGTAFFQDCGTFENTILPDNLPALIYAAKVSRTPYMTPAGPDALNVTALPGGVVAGQPVQLTATINDTRYNNSNGTEPTQNIATAEYYLDVPPWITTTPPVPLPMAAADGNFDEKVEEVVATVDTTGLSAGRHILFVRGQDVNGNWGAVSATFLYLLDPNVSPTIEGFVRDASTNLPLAATVTANNFQATTDPATGYYHMLVVSDTYDLSAVAPGFAISTVTGIEAHNYQTVQQDFFLSPVCAVLEDDVESGNIGWTAQSPWAITAEASHSPTHSWTDSPGGNYSNNRNISLTSPVLDLSGYEGMTLSFWHIYDMEPNWDYGYVEYSTDGGGSWTQAAAYTGYDHETWTQETIPLPALDGQANARIRFRFTSDTSLVADGWHLDDITLTGGGPACITPLAPTAEFTSNSPVILGSPAVFTNQTVGTAPMEYFWDFGDGLGSSTASDPQYLYQTAGTFTVTLVATNSLGSDSVSHPVVVLPQGCLSLTQVTILGPTASAPGTYTFTTTYQPPNATPPITYTWDNGDTGSASVRSLEVGTYTLTVTATNCGAQVTDTHTIVITEPAVCTDVTGVELTLLTTGTLYTGTPVQFLADLAPEDAAKPYSYTVDYGDGSPVVPASSSDDPLALDHTFAATGTYTVEVAVWNCDMAGSEAVTGSLTLTVYEPGTCLSLTGITIVGPTAGAPGTYTFTTTYQPPDATPPITYTWDNGDTGSASVRSLEVGTHTLTVTATNCAGALVTDLHTILIAPAPARFYLYLPLIVKGQ